MPLVERVVEDTIIPDFDIPYLQLDSDMDYRSKSRQHDLHQQTVEKVF